MSAYNVKAHPAFAGYEISERTDEFGGLLGLYAKFSTWRRSRRAYNETFLELDTLSNRDLADIGVSRSDIPHLALEAAKAAK
jgi:uncharacterized protein YjiS (DUF1127 family)